MRIVRASEGWKRRWRCRCGRELEAEESDLETYTYPADALHVAYLTCPVPECMTRIGLLRTEIPATTLTRLIARGVHAT